LRFGFFSRLFPHPGNLAVAPMEADYYDFGDDGVRSPTAAQLGLVALVRAAAAGRDASPGR